MKTYETIFILDSILEDDKVESIKNKYIKLLEKEGSEILKNENWGRKKFANAIKNKQSGFYIDLEFSAKESTIAKLEKAYHLDDSILRFLTISFDKKTLVLRKEYFEMRAANQAKWEQEALEAAAKRLETTESAETSGIVTVTPEENTGKA